jgi:hypothetical protein
MNTDQRWKAVKAHIAAGDKAQGKANDHYKAAGQYLIALKAEHDEAGGGWSEWEIKVKKRAGIGKSRASEIMQISTGTKTPESVAADRRDRQRKAKALTKTKLSVVDGEKPEPEPELDEPEPEPEPESRQPRLPPPRRPASAADLAEQLRPFDQLVADLKKAGLAEQVHDVVRDDEKILYLCVAFVRAGWPRQVLTDFVGQADNGTDAQTSANQRKAELAALDDGSDPGPIPECLRRDRVAS